MSDRDLDRWLAEHVMGWQEFGGPPDELRVARKTAGHAYWTARELRSGIKVADWSPSTRIEHAWMVVERMRELGWLFELEADWEREGCWGCRFERKDVGSQAFRATTADTAPLAISRAAKEALSG